MKYQRLFTHISEEHSSILLDNELQEIVRISLEEHIGDLTNKPPLWGYPTATTAVDGQTIHVGDLVCFKGLEHNIENTFYREVVFVENAIKMKLVNFPDTPPAILPYGQTELVILKKYYEQ